METYRAKDWTDAFLQAWMYAESGEYDQALACYEEADRLDRRFSVAPELALLRHREGHAEGRVQPMPPSEVSVLAFTFEPHVTEAPDAYGLTPPSINRHALADSVRRYVKQFDPGFHAANLRSDLPHVLTLSTGRCGTVSLFRLFEQTNLIPYHSYFWSPSYTMRFEMAARLMSGDVDESACGLMWCKARAAEWLGCESQARPMIGLNHTDTIFAPVFAAVHPSARFLCLRRDPLAVFDSFFRKGQWNEEQLSPIFYGFDDGFRWRRAGWDFPRQIAWYLRFTEAIQSAVAEVFPERTHLVRMDRLFAQDARDVVDLIDFTEAEIPIPQAVDHFRARYNEKAQRLDFTEEQMRRPRAAFLEAYEEFAS